MRRTTMPVLLRGAEQSGGSTTCSLDFTWCAATPARRVHFDSTAPSRPPRKRSPDPVWDEVLAARARRAETKAAEAAQSETSTTPVTATAEDDSILVPIIAQMKREREQAASRNSTQWGCIEEREEAHSWKHATALAGALPESCIVQLLGGPEAVAQVPCARERVDIAVSAIRRRGGPDGAGSRLALVALRTLELMVPDGVPPIPATPAFVAACKRRVDAAARIKYAGRKQGGATAVERFHAGIFALGDKKKGLGLDICTDGLIVIMAVDKFVPKHRDQAATLPVQLLLRACNAARVTTPFSEHEFALLANGGSSSPEELAESLKKRMRVLLHRHTARVIVLAWSFGLRFKHMQRFTPCVDEADPGGVMAGRTSLAKDGEPLDVFAPAMDLLGKIDWYREFVTDFAAYGNRAFPGFTAEWSHAGEVDHALTITGGLATDASSRKGLGIACGVSEDELKALGVSWHSLHGSMADDGSVLATVPISGYVVTHDMLRCLGWWRRNARQNVDAAAAASDAGVIAARARDFSVSVGLPSTLGEMLIRYSSGPGRNGVRARAIAARTAVIAMLAKGVDLIGEAHIAPGARGIQQIQDRIRETLTALRA